MAPGKTFTVQSPVIGVDFGTRSSCVAVANGGNAEVIANAHGTHSTPSVVEFEETEILVGDVAFSHIGNNPKNTVVECKQLLAKKLEDADVQECAKRWPFAVVQKEGKACVQVQFKGQTAVYSPEQLCGHILQNVKTTAEAYVNTTVKNAVVAAPSYFNEAQRVALGEGFKNAGMTVLRVIPDAVAAAIAYELDSKNCNTTVAVFSMGSRSTEVSILKITSGLMEQIATAADHGLGGDEVDDVMLNWCVQEFKKKYKMDPTESKRSVARLRAGCESVKRQLTQQTSTQLQVESAHEGVDFSANMSRIKFEDMVNSVLSKTSGVIQKALQNANMQADGIEKVLLVGGATKIPKVQALVQSCFPGKEICSRIAPDMVVAMGTAIQGNTLVGAKMNAADASKETIAVPVTPKDIYLGDPATGAALVIPEGTSLPCDHGVSIALSEPSQTTAEIKIYEGEPAVENEPVAVLWLEGIEDGPIHVSIQVDEEGTMEIHAKDASGTARHNISVGGSEA